MKLFRKVLLVLAGVLSRHVAAYAQGVQERNEAAFQQVKQLINTQKGDELYALLSDNFKAQFTPGAFTDVLNNGLYPKGNILETSFLTYTNGASDYKAVCANAVLQFRIATDQNGKIAGLRFMPYKEPASNKDYAVPADNTMQTAFDKQVDTLARQYINKITTIGLSIGIINNGVTSVYNYGTTVKERADLPGSNAIFELGSITKTFTAVLLAYYAQEHKLSLSDPITKYLPDSVSANKELVGITLLMLANHTSGLSRLPGNLFDDNTDMADPYKNYNKEKLYAYLRNCKLESKAGRKYAYSNLAAGLLGTILEKVSGLSYDRMVADVICKPLHMNNTFTHPDEHQKKLQVSVYNDKADPVVMWNMDALAGAGALRSDMHDMLLYANANLKKDNTGLSAAIETTHSTTYSKETVVGLGWQKAEIAGMNCYWHNGGTGGSSSYLGFVPGRNIAVVVLSNAAESVDVLATGIVSLLK